MPSSETTTTRITNWLARLRDDDPDARGELLRYASRRLERLASRMLRSYPALRAWEQTGDVLQAAALRLYQVLAEVRPESVHHFFRLAALQIRRQLIDLARSHFRPAGWAARHELGVDDQESVAPAERLSGWAEFHETIASLPDELTEIVELLWYQGLTQPEAAELLGVSPATVKRRWREARFTIFRVTGGECPES